MSRIRCYECDYPEDEGHGPNCPVLENERALRAGELPVALSSDKTPTEKLYPPDLLPWELEPHYSKHVLAMTAEGLHSKAEIASQLAWRDKTISTLRAQLAETRAVWAST